MSISKFINYTFMEDGKKIIKYPYLFRDHYKKFDKGFPLKYP